MKLAVKQKKYLLDYIKRFRALFFLAITLPILIFIVQGSTKLNLLSRAGKKAELRLWIEPASVIIQPQQSTEFKLMAEFNDSSKALNGISILLPKLEGLKIQPQTVSYNQPFCGRIKFADFEIKGIKPGTFQLSIPKTSVITTYSEPLHIISSPLEVIVQD